MRLPFTLESLPLQQNFEAIVKVLSLLNGIRFGTGSVTGDGASVTETATVSHGLGQTPDVAFAIGTTSSAMLCTIGSMTSSTIDVNVRNATGGAWTAATQFNFLWLAIS